MFSARRPHPLVLVLSLICGVTGFGRGQSGVETSNHPKPVTVQQRTSDPADASRCVFCHRSEVDGYARSSMAHSLRRAGHEPEGTVEANGAKITMSSSQNGYWQSLESGGTATKYRIDYVIGSGNHASGYLLDVGDHLFQSPVAYYQSRHAYDLAPGYEGLQNPDFTRPVAEVCLFCHSGTALHVAGTSNQYRSPAFSAESITCERCHGSAEKHLSDPRAGTIINPAKLEPAARDSTCEQCHLLGVGRVLNPDKNFDDFRPGQPLEDTFTTYVNALPSNPADGAFKVISHVEQLARSTCARESKGKLWCGTCHDPHNKPLEPVEFYRAKCVSCHTEKFADSHPAKDSNCIGCHMPRRDAKDGGHTAFTDHRIQRHPEAQPEQMPEADIAAWRDPSPDLQKRNLGIAYINVGAERRSPPLVIRGYRMLTEVQDQLSTDSKVFTSLGMALLLGKQSSEAELAFERALQLDPNSTTGETNAASAYLQAGDPDGAIKHLERAVAIDPLHLPADMPLIALYRQQGNVAKATELSSKLSAALEGQSLADESGGKTSPGNPKQTTEAVFKNIQVLKGASSDQLIPAMELISASLGVQCSYCHVEGHFDKDDKKPKQIARDMMRMTLAIDKDSFEGNREVTCYSCHKGSLKPDATPVVNIGQASKRLPGVEDEKLPVNLPTSDQIIGRYVEALGGAAAIEKISSRVEKGTISVGGESFRIEILSKEPDKEALVRHTPAGDSVVILNGQSGWSAIPGHPVREIHGADLDAHKIEADLHFALHIKNMFSELRVEYPEKIGDRDVYLVSAIRNGLAPVKMYFDEQSGLLVRLVHYAESPLGLLPTQTDYSDYRKTDDVQVAFRRVVAQPGGNSVIQLEQIQENVPINDDKFAQPGSSSATSRPASH
jgi:photosynthetic reaction center cytochrome c subunit